MAAEHSGASRPVVIIGPPPTPNGDLHVGHMAGPYLAADVHARYLRAHGRPVVYATATDDSQTYVLASARKLGTTPAALARKSWHEIRRTLGLMGISVDGFAPIDEDYRAAVLDFLTELHAAGKFRLRTVRLPYSEKHGEYLMEGLIEGDCPICLAESRGGQCETCGHAIDVDELIDPRSRLDATDVLTTREAQILVLPMEEYRDQLTAYHTSREPHWRPHVVQLARELLARPLPDFPITYPTRWGIEAPFAETPGQVINAWAEGMAQWMYCTTYAERQMGQERGAYDEPWRAERDIQLVYFLGFDNGYICGMAHVALLLAYEGRYVLPDTIVSNEFYELENEKFSTSKGHVVRVPDLLAEVPRDLIRFYLALTCPEHQRTNFSRTALDKITAQRLVEPWNRLADLLGEAVAAAGGGAGALPVSAAARGRAAAMLERFRACYELGGFSMARAADLVVVQLDRLQRRAAQLGGAQAGSGLEQLGDLFLEVNALVAGASPITIDLAAAVARAGGLDGALRPGALDVAEV
ncbi:MAG: class I tRNA ligase family protein, partial [Solirubrobacteraceae bacterium]